MIDFFKRVWSKVKETALNILRGIRKVTQWISELFFGALVRVESWIQIFYHALTKVVGAIRAIVIRAIGLTLTIIPTFLMFSKAAWKEYFQMWRQFTFTPKMDWHEELDNLVYLHADAA